VWSQKFDHADLERAEPARNVADEPDELRGEKRARGFDKRRPRFGNEHPQHGDRDRPVHHREHKLAGDEARRRNRDLE
jgi:hypothetical protein